MALPLVLLERLANGVYSGQISLFELPTFLYAWTIGKLDPVFFSGFGKIPKGQIKEIEKAINFRQNIGRFSGAKTFQQVRELTDFVFTPEGFKRPFAEFKTIAQAIDQKYNLDWLATEQESVILQAQNSRKWLKYESEIDIFPTLEYVTVGDDRVRPEHANLDGLRLPVNHPLWKRIHPQNGWRCRCTTIQHTSTARTPSAETEAKTNLMLKDFDKNPAFDYNPGVDDFIFKETGPGKHNYFRVPRQFSQDLKNNFAFPPVSEVTGRQI